MSVRYTGEEEQNLKASLYNSVVGGRTAGVWQTYMRYAIKIL